MSLLINNPVNSRLEKIELNNDSSETGESEHSLVQHQQRPGQARDGCALENDGDQENGGRGGEVEQDERQHEFPVHRDLRYETDQAVHDATKEQRWDDPKWENVKDELG
jgi:hypothetical protein